MSAVAAWWDKTPNANIGIDCGRSGLVVIDVDVKNGAKGGETFMELVAQHGIEAFDTVTARTPSGGRHYVYRGETASGANVYGPGIDVRSRGGYIVAAPSRTPQGAYEWVAGDGKQPIATFPPGLVPQDRPRIALTEETTVITGARNATLTSVAGKMRRQGFTGKEILAALRVFNSGRCRPPLPDLEVVGIARSVSRYTPAEPTTAPPTRGAILSFDDLARRATETVDWAIEGLVRRSGILLLASQPKVGKSELARNMARSVALGEPFLARRCKQGRVLWIGLEEPVSHLHERADVMALRELPITFVVDQPVGDESVWLRGVIEDHRPSLVVVDTIGRFSNIENINDYSQVKRATQPFLDMRVKFGTTFVLLHHNNHANKTLGSTMWEGAVDTIMSLTRNPDGGRFVTTKQRSGLDLEPTAITMNHDTGLISAIEPKFIADQRVAERRILALLENAVPATKEELAKKCTRAISIGRSAVDALVSHGLLSVTGTGTKGDPKLYSVVSGPRSRNTSDSSSGFLVVEESDAPDESIPMNRRGIPTNPNDTEESGDTEESDLPDPNDLFGYAMERL